MKINKKIRIIIVLLILIAILMMSIICFVVKDKKKANDHSSELIDYGSKEIKKINDNQLIGKWNSVREIVGESDLVNYNHSIEFKPGNEYTMIDYSIVESGYYKVEDNMTLFYKDDESLSKGNFEMAYSEITSGQLKIMYPEFPKIIIYEKID